MKDIFNEKKPEKIDESNPTFVQVALDNSGLIKRAALADNFIQYDYMSVKNVRNGQD